MRGNARRRCLPGQALAEVAVMVPFLVIGMMGFLDLGRAFYYQISLTNAVREAARYGAQNQYTGVDTACAFPPAPPGPRCPVPPDTSILQRLTQELSGTAITVPSNSVSVSPPEEVRLDDWDSQSKTRYPVAVSASYQFTFITPVLGSLFGGAVTLQASAEMRTDY